MGKKIIGLIIVVLAIILALVTVYALVESPNVFSEDVAQLTVYSEGPIPLTDIVEDIENTDYYIGYNTDTLKWMKSLGDMDVYQGNGTMVIMSHYDAEKIPSVYATDVVITERFECNIVETHSLGEINYPKNVMLVKNVKYLDEEIIDLGLA